MQNQLQNVASDANQIVDTQPGSPPQQANQAFSQLAASTLPEEALKVIYDGKDIKATKELFKKHLDQNVVEKNERPDSIERLEKIMAACKQTVHNQLKEITKPEKVLPLKEAPKEEEDELSQMNWSYQIRAMLGSKAEILTDIDCIAINMYLKLRTKDPHAKPFFLLVDFTLDLQNMLAFCGHKSLYRFLLERTP